MSDKMLVKMVPFSKKTRHTLKVYNHCGKIFRNDGNWRAVSPELGEELRKVHSRVGDPRSPLAFLVMTESQAREWETAQRRKSDDDMPIIGDTRHPAELMGGDPVIMDELAHLRAKVAAQDEALRGERKQNARLAARLDDDDGKDADDTAEAEEVEVVDPIPAAPAAPVVPPPPAPAPKPAPKPAPAKKAPSKKGATKKRGGKK